MRHTPFFDEIVNGVILSRDIYFWLRENDDQEQKWQFMRTDTIYSIPHALPLKLKKNLSVFFTFAEKILPEK